MADNKPESVDGEFRVTGEDSRPVGHPVYTYTAAPMPRLIFNPLRETLESDGRALTWEIPLWQLRELYRDVGEYLRGRGALP